MIEHITPLCRRIVLMMALLVFSPVATLWAQPASLQYHDAEAAYKEGYQQYLQKNYLRARQLFRETIELAERHHRNKQQLLTSNAKYHEAVCAVELFQPDAEKLLQDFIYSEFETVYKRLSYYQLGRLYFRERKYSDAINWLEQVTESDLSRDQKHEYHFELAYCYFFRKDLEKAEKLFDKTKLVTNKYYYPSNYYYGFIQYENGDLDEALKSFEVVKESKVYAKVIPFYIAQIYSQKGEYAQLTSYLPPILEDNSVKYYAELNQVLGQAYFEQGQFGKAVPYLKEYEKANRKIRPEDAYQLGYALYKNKEYAEALTYLEDLDDRTDTLGQNALYVLADCFVKTDNPEGARSAFQKAANLAYDKGIVEASIFNYGKLSYEQGYDKEAVSTMQGFIKRYPQSKNLKEAQELLTDLFLTTKNYKEALVIMESISDRSAKMYKAYQEIAYFRAVEVFNDEDYDEANRLFDLSLKNPFNDELVTLSYYWKGEAHYRKGNYKPSTWQYSRFLTLAPASNIEKKNWYLTNAAYGNGYAYLKQKQYQKAYVQFGDAISKGKSIGSADIKQKVLPDALLRSGDCSFLIKNYPDAITAYEQVIDGRMPGSDYALYQSGIIAGLQGDDAKKITKMQRITSSYKGSIYEDDAWYEIGDSYFNNGQTLEAINTFNKLISSFNNSPFYTKAYLRLGLIYQIQEKELKALESYNTVIKRYPRSNDATEALEGIKAISISKGQPKIYLDALKRAGRKAETSEEESIVFQAAEAQFNSGNYDLAVTRATDYLNDYPNGQFTLSAHFYRGESLYASGKTVPSLADYEYVIQAGSNDFYERALVRGSSITYNELKDFEKANTYFGLLINAASFKENLYAAKLGMMRTHYQMGELSNVAQYAEAILATTEADPSHQTEAHYYLAKNAVAGNNAAAARPHLEAVIAATTNKLAAESQYLLAKLAFDEGDFEKATAEAIKVRDNFSYEYWTVKGFMIVAETYVQQDNLFQAKATLQSVINNTSIEELKTEAQTRLDELQAIEDNASKLLQEDTTGTFEEEGEVEIEEVPEPKIDEEVEND